MRGKLMRALKTAVVVAPIFTPAATVPTHGQARQTAMTRSFHELNLHGLPNAAGFAVIGVRNRSNPYDLEVSGSEVRARPRIGTGPQLMGATLVGLVIDLRDATGKRYALRVAAASTTTYWAGSSDQAPTYALAYTSAMQQVPQPLCTAGVNEAILFTGDRYDAFRKTVTATGAEHRAG